MTDSLRILSFMRMSKALHEIPLFKVVSACFSKLAANAKYHAQWRMSDQWTSLLWAYYQDQLSPLLGHNEFSGKILDAALRKDKIIKSNLRNYSEESNATGIMCRDYKPRLTLNGIEKKVTVNCYITLPPFAAEPQLKPGQSWWQTLPPTKTRESNRNKRV